MIQLETLKRAFWAAAACAALLWNAPPLVGAEPNAVAVEALKRLKGIDLEANPAVKSALMRVLDSTRGTPQFVELVRDFNVTGQGPALLEWALANPEQSSAVDAVRLILEQEDGHLLAEILAKDQTEKAARAAGLIGKTALPEALDLLKPLVLNPNAPVEARREATASLARSRAGAETLLGWVELGKLPAEVRLAASRALHETRWTDIQQRAEDLLPPPKGRDAKPLPPLRELVQQSGDPARGAEVFAREETMCTTCHRVRGKGQDFGPDLSEIGAKLGKDALYTSILDPSAGVSFGYEAWELVLKNGFEVYGLIVSETDDAVTLKTQNGIVSTYSKEDIAERRQQTLSIMPSGLQQTMSTHDLIDLVEYLSSLKKADP